MKFVTSYSFGKDSALAHYRMARAGHEPVALLTAFHTGRNRSWWHGIPPDLMEAVAQSLGLPLILCACGPEDYGEGLESGLRKAKAMGAETCVFGDIDIEAHADYDRARCEAAGISCELPLWQGGREPLLQECLASGFKPMIKTIRSDILDESLLGRTLTPALAKKIAAAGADICGENGEYHTFVFDGPLFRRPVRVQNFGVVDLGAYKTVDIRLLHEENVPS